MGARFSTELDLWTGPFIMAATNSRVVRRTHALLAAEGRGGCAAARYTEVMSTGRGPRAAITAGLVSAAMTVAVPVLAVGPVRRFLAERFLPKPGEGPDEQTRRRGFFVSRFVATGSHGPVRATMRGEGDPGYDATARMLGESAMSLAFDALDAPGGVRTPASTMAEPLLNRLRAQRITLELQS